MPVWIPVTVAAALFQTWRTALQQQLRQHLSVNATGFVRYLYGVPMAALLLLLGRAATGLTLPVLTADALMFCAAAGLAQILATNLLIMAFGFRNFAVGTAYAKTEAAQSALFAWIVLGQRLTGTALAGIGLGLSGVLTLSLAGRGVRPGDLVAAAVQPAALCGLGAGLLFAFTAIFLRLANQALTGPSILLRALLVLLVTTVLQTAMQGGWLAWREPLQLRLAFGTWRKAAPVGVLSACGSALWFTAFALAPVALVRGVGQIEMVFILLFSRFYVRETLRRGELAGILLVVAGVTVVVASAR